MKIKTDKLTGAALDWAVAKCEGGTDFWYDTIATYWIKLDGKDRALSKGWAQSFTPSTDWDQGGEIIDREKMTLAWGEEEQDWFACIGDSRKFDDDIPDGLTKLTALTPLIAAMRCYVASKLGDEVDVPEELV